MYVLVCRKIIILLERKTLLYNIPIFLVITFQGDQGPAGRRGRNGGDGSVVSTSLRIR